MEHKKIERNNYNINIIKTDRFKSINLTVFFTNIYEKDFALKGPLLPELLTSSSKKYNDYGKIEIQEEELYGAEIDSGFESFGNTVRFRMTIDFLEPKYTESKMFKKSLDFLKECLLNPNIEEGGFNKKIFEINKKIMSNRIKNVNDDMGLYLTRKFNNEMFKGFAPSFSLYNEYEKFINLTPKDLYEFYLNILNNWKIDLYLLGNIDESEELQYIKEIDKIFSSINNKYDKNKDLSLSAEDLNSNFREIIESSKFSQSGLAIGYAFNNLTAYEKRFVIFIYSAILGGTSNSLLFKNIREKKSLCYFIQSFAIRYPASLTVRAEISKENYSETIKQIDKIFLRMNQRRYIKPLIKYAKQRISTSLDSIYDEIPSIVQDYYYREYEKTYNIEIEEIRKIYMSVKIKDIINLNKKISKSIIYFLKGDKE